MKQIAIYGAGGLGREVACLINNINKINLEWDLIGFFDDGKIAGSNNEYGPILGGLEEVLEWKTNLNIVFAIGSPLTILKLSNNITNPIIQFPNLFAPNVIFLDSLTLSLGKGNVFTYGCILSCNVKIGNFNIFNGMVAIGHDTTIGDYNSFMPSVKVSGEVKIGNQNFFGVQSVILQKLKVGNNTIIGANSLVIRNTKDNNTYVGSPASILNY